MATTNAAQLNMGYTYFATAFLAKVNPPKRPNVPTASEEPSKVKNDGAAHFVPKNGKKRYTANKVNIIAVINKLRAKFGDYCRITHAMLERELGLAHGTINANLAQLRADDVIKRENGVNDYKINPDITFSNKDYLTVYSFLFEEITFKTNTEPKKLTGNAVILLCFILRYYFHVEAEAAKKGKNNIKPEDAFFTGGKARIASLLNVAESTAYDAINELIHTGAIFRKAFYIDDNCNEVIVDGKGKSKDYQTVYVLNTKLIRLCKKVRAKMDAAKQKRAKRAEKADKKREQQETREGHRHLNKAEQRQQDFEILKSLYEDNENNVVFEQHKTTPKKRLTKAEKRACQTEIWARLYSKYKNEEKTTPFEERPPTDDDNN